MSKKTHYKRDLSTGATCYTSVEYNFVLSASCYAISRKFLARAQLIDEAAQEVFSQVNKQLTENQLKAVVPDAHSIDLVISSQCVQFL